MEDIQKEMDSFSKKMQITIDHDFGNNFNGENMDQMDSKDFFKSVSFSDHQNSVHPQSLSKSVAAKPPMSSTFPRSPSFCDLWMVFALLEQIKIVLVQLELFFNKTFKFWN